MIEKYRLYLSAVLRLADGTVDVYARHVLRFLRFTAENHIELTDVQGKDVLRFMADRESINSLSATTHILTLVAISHLFNYLLTVGDVEQSPTERIPRPKKFPKIHRCWNVQAVKKIIETPNLNTVLGTRDRCIFELLYATGIRRQELVSLRVFDIDFKEKVVFIRGKGNRERLLPITLNSLYWLEKYREVRVKLCRDRPPDSLFISQFGTALSYASVYKLTKRHARKAGFPDFSPHAFRHAFATHLLHNGANLMMVKLLLGHEQIDTTQIYTHLEDDRLEKIHQQYFPRA